MRARAALSGWPVGACGKVALWNPIKSDCDVHHRADTGARPCANSGQMLGIPHTSESRNLVDPVAGEQGGLTSEGTHMWGSHPGVGAILRDGKRAVA